MSEGSQGSKVIICVRILEWQSLTDPTRAGIELPGQLKVQQGYSVFKSSRAPPLFLNIPMAEVSIVAKEF